MTPVETPPHNENTTRYKVFPCTDGTNFWMYAETTRINSLGKQETTLEILLPRVRIEDLSSEHRAKYRETVADATEESPSADPPQPLRREKDLRHPLPV